MLASLRRLSEASGMVLLAHLVDLACAEAQRNAHVAKAENELSGATPIKRPPESVPN